MKTNSYTIALHNLRVRTIKFFIITCISTLAPPVFAGLITVNIKNTDSVAHSFCIKTDTGTGFMNGYSDRVVAGGTRSVLSSLNNGNKVKVVWGVDQGAGSSNSSNKPYDCMRADDGTTEYTVVGSGDASTPNFETVVVTISPATQSVAELSTGTMTVSRSGSTSYALTVAFTTSGDAEFSPSRDYSLLSGGTWVLSSVTIPSGTGNSSVSLVFYAWNDHAEGAEHGVVTLSPAIKYQVTADECDTTIPANNT
jgi:hypothetical protein